MSALPPKATLNAFIRNNLNIGKLDEMAETPLPGKSGVYRPHGNGKSRAGTRAALSCRELPTLVQLIERTANASGQILGKRYPEFMFQCLLADISFATAS